MKVLFPIVGALIAVPALAGGPQAATDGERAAAEDPNQIVCVNERELGSRLAKRRVCRTRAEWATHRAQSRLMIERVQSNKQTCTGGGTCLPSGPGGQ